MTGLFVFIIWLIDILNVGDSSLLDVSIPINFKLWSIIIVFGMLKLAKND